MQTILIYKDIQEEAYLWNVDYQSLYPKNRSLALKVPQRKKLWALTNSCQPSAEPNISLRHKAKMLRMIACTRTTRVPLFWIKMGRPRVEKVKSTLKLGIYLSQIGLIMVKCHYSGVPQGI